MRVNILNSVFFSIIWFFGYGKNILHFINESSICLERDIINLENNRILAGADNQFDLNNFYGSTLTLADQLNDYKDDYEDDDDEVIKKIQNIIDSHREKDKRSNTLPNLNNVDKKTKKLIHELRTELDEVKKELDNIKNNKLAIQPIQDKRIVNRREVASVSNYEGLNGSEYLRVITANEQNAVNTTADDKLKNIRELNRKRKGLYVRAGILIIMGGVILIPGVNIWAFLPIIVGATAETLFRCYQFYKLGSKIYKIPKNNQIFPNFLKSLKFLKPQK
ncbi:fam-b protein [Plasmodium chabaudi chabaudi]|uniref:Fam-b protein n=1 Tax=Plasmodium chabaudi chabaudi TaxID=31271 RepID=A0A1C6WDY1_PLACU|nr:fam-b protein [Plasmodium chabaudi chabaudi]SCL90197.1 fam-b protein [Plasmodium chabaudi chabaudi]